MFKLHAVVCRFERKHGSTGHFFQNFISRQCLLVVGRRQRAASLSGEQVVHVGLALLAPTSVGISNFCWRHDQGARVFFFSQGCDDGGERDPLRLHLHLVVELLAWRENCLITLVWRLRPCSCLLSAAGV